MEAATGFIACFDIRFVTSDMCFFTSSRVACNKLPCARFFAESFLPGTAMRTLTAEELRREELLFFLPEFDRFLAALLLRTIVI